MQLPKRRGTVWQGGWSRTPLPVSETDLVGSRRPHFAIWVTETGAIHTSEEAVVEPNARGDLEAFVELAYDRESGGYLPETIQIADPRRKQFWLGALEGLGIEVQVVDFLPAVEEAHADFLMYTTQISAPPRGALTAPGVKLPDLRALVDAGIEFFDAAPWQFLSDQDLLEIEAPKPIDDARFATVLGRGGVRCGIGFYTNRWDFDRMMRSITPEEFAEAAGHWFVDIVDPEELPAVDHDLWECASLPLTSDGRALQVERLGRAERRPPNRDELAFFEGLLRALAATTDDDWTAGRLERTVGTIEGAKTYRLALPDVLSHTARSAGAQAPSLRVPKSAKGSSAEIGDQAAPSRQRQAMELTYRASECRGRTRRSLAKQALELDPDCTAAYNLLADTAADEDDELHSYDQAIAAWQRRHAADAKTNFEGHYWLALETRPYLRAIVGRAVVLERMGREADAVDAFEHALALDPEDHIGARYELLPLLMEGESFASADRLLEKYPDDASALFTYAAALSRFAREGDTESARMLLSNALGRNPHAARFLSQPDRIESILVDMQTFGSPEEGMGCADELIDVWMRVPHAMEWLRKRLTQREASLRKRERAKGEKKRKK